MSRKITVEIVSDVVCPWCYIGKRRLEKAIQELSDKYIFEIIYHPFELNPDVPLVGVIQKDYLVKKFGGEEKHQQLTRHVTEVAAQEGLLFDFDKQKILPNTRRLHAIVKQAGLQGLQGEMAEAFYKAYFVDGIDLSADENIVHIASSVGLNNDEVMNLLNDEKALQQTAGEEREIYQLGITSVPFYIINKRYGISGAQPAENFVKAFERVGETVEEDVKH